MLANWRLKMRPWLVLASWLSLMFVLVDSSHAQNDEPIDPDQMLLPQNLLKVLHAPEVHSELKLAPKHIQSLEKFFGLFR